jgi:hypothetical protein
VQHKRDVELSKEQARLLVYAKDQRTVREHELESLLEMERERSAAAVSNHSNLVRALETAEGRVTELSEALSAVVTADTSSGKGGGAQDDLYEQLQREKERVVVLTAKFNTLKARADQPEPPLPAVLPFKPSRYEVCAVLFDRAVSRHCVCCVKDDDLRDTCDVVRHVCHNATQSLTIPFCFTHPLPQRQLDDDIHGDRPPFLLFAHVGGRARFLYRHHVEYGEHRHRPGHRGCAAESAPVGAAALPGGGVGRRVRAVRAGATQTAEEENSRGTRLN